MSATNFTVNESKCDYYHHATLEKFFYPCELDNVALCGGSQTAYLDFVR